MKEFRVIDAARSEEQLRLRLKHSELEEYGEAFTPEYVYQVIRQLPRFRDMRVSKHFQTSLPLSLLSSRWLIMCFFLLSVATSKMLKSFWGSSWRNCTRSAAVL